MKLSVMLGTAAASSSASDMLQYEFCGSATSNPASNGSAADAYLGRTLRHRSSIFLPSAAA